MEKYVRNVRFILICNYVSSVIPAVQSRCTKFRFGPVASDSIREKLESIARKEGKSEHVISGLSVRSDAYDAIASIVKDSGDLRRSINILQAAASSKDTANAQIDSEAIYGATSCLRPDHVMSILDVLTNSHMEDATKGIFCPLFKHLSNSLWIILQPCLM